MNYPMTPYYPPQQPAFSAPQPQWHDANALQVMSWMGNPFSAMILSMNLQILPYLWQMGIPIQPWNPFAWR